MAAYEHISVLISFFVSLGFAHVLIGAAGLVQSPARVRISVPHALWVLVAVSCLLDTWLGLFEHRTHADWDIPTVLLLIGQATVAYLLAALVMPASFILDGIMELHEFHTAHRRSYILAFMGFIVIDVAVAAVLNPDIGDPVESIALAIAFVLFLAPALLALLSRQRWAQVTGPAIIVVLAVAYWALAAPVLA